jgi:hypothetical protein
MLLLLAGGLEALGWAPPRVVVMGRTQEREKAMALLE